MWGLSAPVSPERTIIKPPPLPPPMPPAVDLGLEGAQTVGFVSLPESVGRTCSKSMSINTCWAGLCRVFLAGSLEALHAGLFQGAGVRLMVVLPRYEMRAQVVWGLAELPGDLAHLVEEDSVLWLRFLFIHALSQASAAGPPETQPCQAIELALQDEPVIPLDITTPLELAKWALQRRD